MKKMNSKGFTLIELLAVITIMGILMMVAIPTVSRTIENSRKDTFIDTMKSYVGYTDHSFGSNGRKNIFVSAYNPLKAKIELEDITDERELKMVSEVLNQIDKENA